ncbi:hypothetical protein PVAP13_1NG424538 [Panicum virgatum]|uniref:Uncharacterized protein n=1 Tax=Panicum virgatum TaxID=38727 RepID=A0A8T0X335_PANVG|nr:hypothetical protein PVAP13_1NG424538 [Panicum virgatum]
MKNIANRKPPTHTTRPHPARLWSSAPAGQRVPTNASRRTCLTTPPLATTAEHPPRPRLLVRRRQPPPRRLASPRRSRVYQSPPAKPASACNLLVALATTTLLPQRASHGEAAAAAACAAPLAAPVRAPRPRAVPERVRARARAGVRRGVQLLRDQGVPVPGVRALPRRLRGRAARLRGHRRPLQRQPLHGRARQQPLHLGRAGERAAAARAAPVRLPLPVAQRLRPHAVPDHPGRHLLDHLHHQAAEPHAVPGGGAREPDAGAHQPRCRRHGHVPRLLPVPGRRRQRHCARHLRHAAGRHLCVRRRRLCRRRPVPRLPQRARGEGGAVRGDTSAAPPAGV